VNFAQGKEYARQERATAGAALSRAQFDAVDRRQLRQLETPAKAGVQGFYRIAQASTAGSFVISV
jgi:hypothetical protein